MNKMLDALKKIVTSVAAKMMYAGKCPRCKGDKVVKGHRQLSDMDWMFCTHCMFELRYENSDECEKFEDENLSSLLLKLGISKDNYIHVCTDFSKNPGPRYSREGENSGEEFREKILYPKLKNAIENGMILYVDLDGVSGYGTSFLDEAFHGTMDKYDISFEDMQKHIHILSKEEPFLVSEIWDYCKK